MNALCGRSGTASLRPSEPDQQADDDDNADDAETPPASDHQQDGEPPSTGPQEADDEVDDGPLPRELADEVSCVAAWLDAEASRLRLVACDGELASPLPRLPSYEPRGRK